MKLNRLGALVAMCIVPMAFAQTTTAQPVQDPRTMPAEVVTPPERTPSADMPVPPSTSSQPREVIVLPEKVIETNVDLTTGGPQSPQSARDARIEATNALAEVRAQCRREGHGSPNSQCMRNAQADHDAMLAKINGRR
jgi:hypothetical protein